VLVLFGLLLAYLLLWPVPLEPVAWESPPNPGYTGPFAANERLGGLEMLDLGGDHGPEDVALDEQGRIYAATHEGHIVRLDPDGRNPQIFAETGGRPLGIDFDADGNLIVANALLGLQSVAPDGTVRVLAEEADGIPLRYTDDVDVAADGRIFFSDASTKFFPEDYEDTLYASYLDIIEHGGHGRLVAYHPETGKATTVLDGLQFANGVAVSPDQDFVLVNETGSYQVTRYWLTGPQAGSADRFCGSLPGLPDNVSVGRQGRFWVALVTPRNNLLDSLSEWPSLRKVVPRLPGFIRPGPKAYGHVIALDKTGNVVIDLQDPQGRYFMNTTAVESPDGFLYLGNLSSPAVARLPLEGKPD
jgi:sugar lactone lactonase YvrE